MPSVVCEQLDPVLCQADGVARPKRERFRLYLIGHLPKLIDYG